MTWYLLEADSWSASQEYLLPYYNLLFLREMKPIHILPHNFLKMYINFTFLSTVSAQVVPRTSSAYVLPLRGEIKFHTRRKLESMMQIATF